MKIAVSYRYHKKYYKIKIIITHIIFSPVAHFDSDSRV